ncbi:hypothetical protein HDF16_005857 [Granulicella aggregans]|uniref:Cytochrome P460 domain-containing protein n=1 Tax=Granulicella aggregans TaxID=474949 RepID=A0A7W7ZKY9_9BACT|nr:cytochrome P460 family protein [Granulicella aggregans]MBB5061121.1 hypothetical protein [Granulicella aggregans]
MSEVSSVAKRVTLKVLLALGVVGPPFGGLVARPKRVLERTRVTQDAESLDSLPPGYRYWRLVSVAHEAGKLNDLRAILGNDKAIDAYRSATLPFPDGTIIARLAWTYTSSPENNSVFGDEQSFVAGAATNVQLMIKDSKKYSATGGWGFEQFDHGKPVSAEATSGCYACHAPVKDRDYVFTRYTP